VTSAVSGGLDLVQLRVAAADGERLLVAARPDDPRAVQHDGPQLGV